mgnify:CR=1 FL=1
MRDSYELQKLELETDNLLGQIVEWQNAAKKLLDSNNLRRQQISDELKKEELTEGERVHFEFEQSMNSGERNKICQMIDSVMTQMERFFEWKAAEFEPVDVKNVMKKLRLLKSSEDSVNWVSNREGKKFVLSIFIYWYIVKKAKIFNYYVT